jgi:hypothetical protein
MASGLPVPPNATALTSPTSNSNSMEMIDYRSEKWRPIDDFYEVSNLGRVAEIGGRLLHRRMNDLGYFVVRLSSPRRLEEVHRLVALAFVPNPTELPAIIHVNGNPTDNRPINLKWCSSETEVLVHSHRPRRRFPQLTERSRAGKVDDKAYRGNSINCEPVSRAIPPIPKKHIIRCRHCSHRWSDKVQFAIRDTASSSCPSCGTRNRWIHSVLESAHREDQAVSVD